MRYTLHHSYDAWDAPPSSQGVSFWRALVSQDSVICSLWIQVPSIRKCLGYNSGL